MASLLKTPQFLVFASQQTADSNALLKFSSHSSVPTKFPSRQCGRCVLQTKGGLVVCQASEGQGEASPPLIVKHLDADAEDRGQFDVSSNCVTPAFRVSPLAEELGGEDGTKVHILFLSEGNVCRSVFAEAIFNSLLLKHGLQDMVCCSSKATRDYNVGEGVDSRAASVAEEHGLALPDGKVGTLFDCSSDIVRNDLVLVMDKFTASDALKEITVYEIVNKNGLYSSKVRRLGEFCELLQIEDIEDPLYGNSWDAEELESVREVLSQVRGSCQGLVDYILDVRANLEESESFRDGMARALGRMGALNWLAPPMLSRA